MTKYATFGADGILNARYDDEENKIIPAEAIQISDELCSLSIHERGYLQLIGGVVTWVALGPVIPTPAQLIATAHHRINSAYEQAIAALNAEYPNSEVASWPTQGTEALAYLADPKKADTPWLKGAAKGRNISVDNLALRVKRKADVYLPAYGELTGKRQRLRDAIEALGEAPTQAQLDAIQW